MRCELYRAGKFLFGLQHVRGDVDNNRSRTSAAGPVKSFGDHFGDFIDRTNDAAPLGQREGDAKNVGLLKSIGANEGTANLPGNADQRNGIHLRVGDAGDEIRRARAAGRNRYPDLPSYSRISFGREHGALFVSREHVPETAALERVIQRHDCPSRVTEHEFDPFSSQALQNDLGPFMHSPPVFPLELRRISWLPSGASSSSRATALPRSRSGAAFPSRVER